MSEQVSRAEFNELKGQLDLVCQHLGLELGDFVVQGSGRRRAEVVPVEVQDFSGFQQESSFEDSQEEDVTPVFAEEEAKDSQEDEGWESINDDEDPDHTISYDTSEEEATEEEEAQEESFEENVYPEPVSVEVVEPEVRHLPTSLNYVEPEDEKEEEDDTPLFSDEDEEESYIADEVTVLPSNGVDADVLSRIFDAEKILTANDVASKQFSEIKKTLFTSPYDVDTVDEFLDEYLDVLQTKDISESKYAEALLNLEGRKFPENSEGYKKAEVDAFVEEIASELRRRIEIVS